MKLKRWEIAFETQYRIAPVARPTMQLASWSLRYRTTLCHVLVLPVAMHIDIRHVAVLLKLCMHNHFTA